MDKPSEKFEIPPLRVLGGKIGEYLSEWPFMCHAGLVLLFAWIVSFLHSNVALVCVLGFLYLYQIESRQRRKLHWKIRHEERKNASKQRLAEGETVRWMNEALEKIWPVFMENFASKMLLVPLTSFFDRFKPWSAKKMQLQNLSLGKTPPIVTMLRILDDPIEGDDLAIEAGVEWMAASDMAAVVAVKVRRRLGLGIWATFHISKLCFDGKVKISLKLKDSLPVIQRVRISFATAPYLEMAAYPIYNSGVDVTELPGLASWMDRLVADALAQSLVEPNMLEIDVDKLLKDVLRPQGPAQPLKNDWFSMRGNPPAAEVNLEVLEATDLRVGDYNGFSDPFVRVMLGLQQAETTVKWKTLNPKWNETFRFTIPSWEQPNTMLIKVRDKDHIFDDQLGHNAVDLTRFRDGKRHDFWLTLKGVDTGKLHLAVTVLDKQTDSSEDTLSLDDQIISELSDRSQSLSQPLAASPKDRVSTRQKLKSLKSGKSLTKDPLRVDTSGKAVGRQSSGFFGSRSLRKLDRTQLGSDREQLSARTEENPSVAPRGLSSAQNSMSKDADVAGESVDDTTILLNVGVGEEGAVKVCQLGDVALTPRPSQRVPEEEYSKPLDQASLGGDLANIEEDVGPARKHRSAKAKYQDYRARRGAEKEAEQQELEQLKNFSTNNNGTRVHLTLDPSGDQSMTGLHVGQDPTSTTSGSVGEDGETVDAEVPSGGYVLPPKHQVRNKTKGFFGKAAGQLGHQFSRKLIRRKQHEKEGPTSSEDVTTSGEFSGPLESGVIEPRPETEVPGAKQPPLPLTSTSHPHPRPSEPPHRPPPALPPPGAPIDVQASNDMIHFPQPSRAVPIADAQQTSTQAREDLENGLLKPDEGSPELLHLNDSKMPD